MRPSIFQHRPQIVACDILIRCLAQYDKEYWCLMQLRIHAILERSLTNGPGERFVCWFQGCSIRCPGCFNPETHDPLGGYAMRTSELFDQMSMVDGINGVTISGGEPFDQAEALRELVTEIRNKVPLNILVYTGFTLEELESSPTTAACLRRIDWLISGGFDRAHRINHGPMGSSNQVIHQLSGLAWCPGFSQSVEVQVDTRGELVVTGFPGDWKGLE